MEKTRLTSIDIARAICIILVVIGHYIPKSSPDWYVTINRAIYAFHMPLFMFVSGYIYWATRKPVKYKDFVWKKFQRLMIPYFFASIIIITIKLLSEKGLSVQNPVTISAFYEMFYLPVAGFFLWFVFALFLMFLIIPFFNTRKHLSILLLIALVLHFIPMSFPQVFCLAQFKKFLLYFVLGCVSFEWLNVRKFIDKIHFLIALCVFVGIFILKVHTADVAIIKKMVEICIAFTGIVFILNLSKYVELKTVFITKILLNVSICSYTIYLFHTTFEGFTKAIFLKFPFLLINLNDELAFILVALVVILSGVIMPIIMHEIIIRYSKFFSFLIGARFVGKKNK